MSPVDIDKFNSNHLKWFLLLSISLSLSFPLTRCAIPLERHGRPSSSNSFNIIEKFARMSIAQEKKLKAIVLISKLCRAQIATIIDPMKSSLPMAKTNDECIFFFDVIAVPCRWWLNGDVEALASQYHQFSSAPYFHSSFATSSMSSLSVLTLQCIRFWFPFVDNLATAAAAIDLIWSDASFCLMFLI